MKYVYCLFCRTQGERNVAEQTRQRHPCVAICPKIIRRKWVRDQAMVESFFLYPGYVFLFAKERLNASDLQRLDGVLRVLSSMDGVYELCHDDERFARWLLQNNGIIGVSKAIREGSRIRVTEGPMKDYGGTIIKVNKQRRRALVVFQFDGVARSCWMDFDWVDANDA